MPECQNASMPDCQNARMSDNSLSGNIPSIWTLSGVQGLTFPTPTTTTRTTTSGTTTSGTTTGAPKDGKS